MWCFDFQEDHRECDFSKCLPRLLRGILKHSLKENKLKIWWNYQKYLLKLVILRHCITPCSLAALVSTNPDFDIAEGCATLCSNTKIFVGFQKRSCWNCSLFTNDVAFFLICNTGFVKRRQIFVWENQSLQVASPLVLFTKFWYGKTKGSDTLLNFQIENSNNLAFIIHTCAHVHTGESINIRRAGINPRKTYCACCSR